MNRRQFVFTLPGAVALFAARPGRAECGGLSIREFVETTYYKQARLHAEKTPLGNDDFYALFSPGMQRLMQAPRQYNKNQMIGPLLNAFFGYGVLPGAEITVGKVERYSGDEAMGPATIRVGIEHRGDPHKLLVHIVGSGDDWGIANIIYDSGRSLVDHYRSITGG
jgi:hypothetical protein